MLVITGALALAAGAHADAPVGADQGKAIVDKLAQSVADAKAFDYEATVSAGSISETGVVGDPKVYTVKCQEQEPNCFRITVSTSDKAVGEFACNATGGTFYDAKSKSYFTFPLNTDADWAALHGAVDKETGGPDLGNIVDSTLIHKPMFDLENQYHRDSPVTYSVTPGDIGGRKVSRVLEHCTTEGVPMEEAVAVDTDGNLVVYSAYLIVEGKQILSSRQLFKSLKLLTEPLPDSTFQFTPPPGSQKLGG